MIYGENINPMSTTHVTISPKTIGKLLREERLKVPPSQREYRWKVEHAEDLFTDIRKAMDSEKGSEEYFLGSIVSISMGDTIMIYDGQQRLATIMILIAAIRNALIELGNTADADVAERNYLFSRLRQGTELTPNLILNLADKDFFFKNVLPRPEKDAAPKPKGSKVPPIRLPDSHRRMSAVAKFAKQFVSTLIDKRQPDDADIQLNRWLDYIEKALHVIWVQVHNESTAFTIFETMNDRGLKLSAADLLKNYLHSKAEDQRDDVMHKWSSMVGTLKTVEGEEENVVEYIRCYWVSRYGHVRTKYLYDKIKEKITNPQKALEMLTELEMCVQKYAAIIMETHSDMKARGHSSKTAIAKLNRLGVTQLRPMLLSAFEKFTQGEFAKLVERCVSWSVRFLISGTSSGTIEGYYSRAAVKIWKGEITGAEGVYEEMKKIIPKDELFRTSFLDAEETNPRIARYYLSELQHAEDGTWPDQALTLEHLLDKKYNPDIHTSSEPEHKENVFKIGNLALINEEDNGLMQGMTFVKKRPILAKAGNPSLTKKVSENEKWEEKEILHRQSELTELAVKAWPI